MNARRVVAVFILILLGSGAAGWWYIHSYPEALFSIRERLQSPIGELETRPLVAGIAASGNIEAREIKIVAEMGGRVELLADEGDVVTQGQVLARLDTAVLDAQMKQAQAALAVARARLDVIRQGAHPAEIKEAEAAVQQAQAARDGALVSWQDALAMRDNPQELKLQINTLRAQLAVAEHQVSQAAWGKDAAEAGKRMADQLIDLLNADGATERIKVYDGPIMPGMPLPPGVPDPQHWVPGQFEVDGWTIRYDGNRATIFQDITINIGPNRLKEAREQIALSTYEWWKAWEALNIAQAQKDGLERDLAQLLAMQDNPLALQTQVDAAEARYRAAEAALETAKAQLVALRAGPTAEQIALAEAQVHQAEAAVRTIEVQIARQTLRAPANGLVTERMVHPGELAAPGAPLLTLADLDQVTLTVYVPEDEIGQVRLGDSVEVSVDAFPGRIFHGRVTYIAHEAEFTPKNVQTRKERVNLVFAVKVQLANPDHALKPGMPADAIIKTTG